MIITLQVNLERRKGWRVNASWNQTDEHIRLKYFTYSLKSLKEETDLNSSQLQRYHPAQLNRTLRCWTMNPTESFMCAWVHSKCSREGLSASETEFSCLSWGGLSLKTLAELLRYATVYTCRARTFLAGSLDAASVCSERFLACSSPEGKPAWVGMEMFRLFILKLSG